MTDRADMTPEEQVIFDQLDAQGKEYIPWLQCKHHGEGGRYRVHHTGTFGCTVCDAEAAKKKEAILVPPYK